MVFRNGTPSAEVFDRILIDVWAELAAILARHMPGLKAPAALTPDTLADAIYLLGIAARRFPSGPNGTVQARRERAFSAAAAQWLTVYGLKSRYDDHLYRGDHRQTQVWQLAARAHQVLVVEVMPRLRFEFRAK